MKYKNKKIPIDAAFADVPGLQEEGNHLTNAAENGNHRAAISLLEDPAKRLIRARRFSVKFFLPHRGTRETGRSRASRCVCIGARFCSHVRSSARLFLSIGSRIALGPMTLAGRMRAE
jgi:hypothetical protein